MATRLLFVAIPCLLVLMSCYFLESGAVSARGSLIPSHRNEEDEYDWLCPRVVCSPLPKDCQLWEYIVLDYSYRVRRKFVNVRCQSCPYCLDLPKRLTRRRRQASPGQSRSRRSLYSLLGWTMSYRQSEDCVEVNCPELPESCADVRLTDVVIRGRLCKQCPACYDDLLISNQDTL